jgi:hypothetical protein
VLWTFQIRAVVSFRTNHAGPDRWAALGMCSVSTIALVRLKVLARVTQMFALGDGAKLRSVIAESCPENPSRAPFGPDAAGQDRSEAALSAASYSFQAIGFTGIVQLSINDTKSIEKKPKLPPCFASGPAGQIGLIG